MFKQVYASDNILLQYDFVCGGVTVQVEQPQTDVFDPYGNKVATLDLKLVAGHYLTYYTAPSTTLGTYFAIAKGTYNHEQVLAASRIQFDVLNALDLELATLEEVKDYLGITTYTEDSILQGLLLAASSAILQYTQFKLGIVTKTEIKELNNVSSYSLRYFPINEITSITLDDEELVEGTDEDYYVDKTLGILYFPGGLTGLFECVYTIGETQVPAPMKLACLKTVSTLYNLRESEGFSSQRILSNVENYLRDVKMDLMFEVRSLLEPYRRKLA